MLRHTASMMQNLQNLKESVLTRFVKERMNIKDSVNRMKGGIMSFEEIQRKDLVDTQ